MKKTKFIIITLLLIAMFVFSMNLGSSNLKIIDLFYIDSLVNQKIIFNIRLPRIILSILVGANLSIAGVLLQSSMQNPLADPGIIGVSSGASLVSLVIILLFPEKVYLLNFLAFLGGVCSCLLIISLSFKGGRINSLRLILSGVAINTLLGGIMSFLFIVFSDELQGALMWLNGSLSSRGWENIKIMLPVTIIGFLLALYSHKDANLLQLGDCTAANLGINPTIKRIKLIIIACFLSGISVANVGMISFLGLIVPHISRKIIGTNHIYLIPFSGVLGSLILLLADTFSRNIFSPFDIPVGIVTSAIGVPFFLYLLKKRGE